MPLRAAIYRRVSKDEQRIAGRSLESQQEDALKHAAGRGYVVVWDGEDVDSGDLLDQRDALWELRQLVRRRLVDVVITWKIDRLSRSVDNQTVILYEFRKYGVL